MKKKYCKNCKALVDGTECHVCKSTNFTNSFQGRIFILDSDKSAIGKKIGITDNGEYALKVR